LIIEKILELAELCGEDFQTYSFSVQRYEDGMNFSVSCADAGGSTVTQSAYQKAQPPAENPPA